MVYKNLSVKKKLMFNVSYFTSYRDAKPKTINLYDFLTSKKYKDEVEKIRATKDKKVINDLKSKLPAITPSGLFKERRSVKNLIHHTGLIQIDIDKQDNEHLNISETKELLKDIEQILFCAYSVSGKGLFALVEVSEPQHHLEHFLALEDDFKNDFNIIIDKSCKDVTRLRGYSYDDDYYINDNHIVYTKKKIKKKPQKPHIKPNIINTNDNFIDALNKIDNFKIDITGSNEQWFNILCSIASEYGESGRGFAHIVSRNSTLYDFDRCDKDYTRALKTNYNFGIGTFYHYYKNAV